MTRKQQISKALALLGLPPGEGEALRKRINELLAFVDNKIADTEEDKVVTSKKGKKALEQYISALRRVQAAHNNLDASMANWFMPRAVIDHDIAEAEALLTRPSKEGAPLQLRKRAAVMMAYRLLADHGCTPTVTRNGKWDQLAKVLADCSTDLLDLMREFKRDMSGFFVARRKTG